ncbi:DUF4065 domain-containing protein [Staphylococcus saprophyticus]|uniref:DUF4065 domain-containing protein n=1 Tax=Staphylococcus cohnii TaxID=29382 RepID=A0A2T4LQR2_9STAP|nr:MULTISPECIES: type II toxin-antitoxin system antitoxin SocA domain-containing protein [Staphylococcus]AMG20693.1 DUF4065 domain-containing protein [Staphylococcus saprophyticus]MDW3861830.1 DUF4065 domain-containing protein [Staphylococcus saprophyticus]MDW3914094.1 DUF4065 domain-containing protein [Staphylococcus saprophyticus]MDW3924161.1 DUF4065 domain-containing protein [Staphylococcus saprophyticus]MDW3961867.1 DUF4065 domain-containing protein [Staphylococcus saprophyticus]
MTRITELAKYLIKSYETNNNAEFEKSELKLQKLMYFAQREAIAITGEPLFENQFEGWQYGPVLTELRHFFEEDQSKSVIDLDETSKYIIDNTVTRYGKYEPWYIANLSHKETSWKNSRKGLSDNEKGNNLIKLEDIKKDADNVRLYDHLYDMYIDEFEEADEENMNFGL